MVEAFQCCIHFVFLGVGPSWGFWFSDQSCIILWRNCFLASQPCGLMSCLSVCLCRILNAVCSSYLLCLHTENLLNPQQVLTRTPSPPCPSLPHGPSHLQTLLQQGVPTPTLRRSEALVRLSSPRCPEGLLKSQMERGKFTKGLRLVAGTSSPGVSNPSQ